MEIPGVVAGLSGLLYVLATMVTLALVGIGVSVSIAHPFLQLVEHLKRRTERNYAGS